MVYTTNSTSNNDTLMIAIERTCYYQNIDFTKDKNHVQCLAHIINLTIQDALRVLNTESTVDKDNIFNLNENGDILDIIPKVICNYDLLALNLNYLHYPIQLHRLVVKICASPQCREKFSRQCEAARLLIKELILDVKTCWNST